MLFTDLAWSSLQREVAIVLVVRDCSRTFPSRGTTHFSDEQLYRTAADADVSCAIPHRMGHSILSNVRLATSVSWLAVTTSRVTFELAQAGGISSRTGRLGSNNHRQMGIRFSFLSLHSLLFLFPEQALFTRFRPDWRFAGGPVLPRPLDARRGFFRI